MSTANDIDPFQDYTAHNNFVVNCLELAALEARLGDFSRFQMLGVEHTELKHSNMLAWLLNPAQGHGMDDLFFQHWLMRTLHSAGASI